MRYTLPLAEIVFDFFDQLKSRTRGYASLDYEPDGDQAADLVKVDILLQGETGRRVHRDRAQGQGLRLRRHDGRQAAGAHPAAAVRGADPGRRSASRVIARENIRAIRKDVLAKCYGGDITRKRKLLEKQKEGKKRMKMVGSGRGPAGGLHRRALQRRRDRQEVAVAGSA